MFIFRSCSGVERYSLISSEENKIKQDYAYLGSGRKYAPNIKWPPVITLFVSRNLSVCPADN